MTCKIVADEEKKEDERAGIGATLQDLYHHLKLKNIGISAEIVESFGCLSPSDVLNPKPYLISANTQPFLNQRYGFTFSG